MVSEATDISYIKVDSELEALLLEAKLINKYKPKYNVISKDDKHPLYIKITNDEYPRILTARKTQLEKNAVFFGPFPNSRNVHLVLRSLRKIFPFSDHKIGKRPCLYSHIGLCNPCPNEITQIEDDRKKSQLSKIYLKNIKSIRQILSGKITSVKKSLENEMRSYAKAENFEEAAAVRNKINRLDYITRPRIPAESYIDNPNLLEDTRRAEILELKSLINKTKLLKIGSLTRIECFDIAHLSGTGASASMVVFIDGVEDKSEYRHFRIRQKKGQSDYDSMKEIAKRRLRQNWEKPNLIIVDGGAGQVSSFRSEIKEIPVVGIAKNPDRIVFDSKNKIRLKGGAMKLMQRMRDEAHRFARVYHRKLLTRSLLQ